MWDLKAYSEGHTVRALTGLTMNRISYSSHVLTCVIMPMAIRVIAFAEYLRVFLIRQ